MSTEDVSRVKHSFGDGPLVPPSDLEFFVLTPTGSNGSALESPCKSRSKGTLMPILWPGIAWEWIWESNKKIFWGEAVRLTDLPAGSWSGSGHLNRCHEAVDASPHPNGSVKASHFDLNINWDGLPGDTKGIYGLFRGWLAKGLEAPYV